jgi:hypothetical protein
MFDYLVTDDRRHVNTAYTQMNGIERGSAGGRSHSTQQVYTAHNREGKQKKTVLQKVDRRQQTADGRQQTADSRQQTADSR